MVRRLRIILWVAIWLTVAALLWINLGWMLMMRLYPSGEMMPNVNFPAFIIFFALIFVCGVLIVRWTRKNVTQNPLKRYLLMAGASAMGILFFGTVVHMLTEVGFVMSLFVCPLTLIVGAALALKYKASPQITE
jgi:cytochrome b subunit of formate dehydrogenase